ncbi:MAG: hypothetical protein ACE5HQ_02840 [Gemmatimonadota bacterium]
MARGAEDEKPAARRPEAPGGPLIRWLAEHNLLRGPFLFVDYWASVLRLDGVVPQAHVDGDLLHRALFRAGLDRPDLEIPRLRYYLALFLVGPLLVPFRFFRRLGPYRVRFRRRLGHTLFEALEPYLLELEERGAGRVRVRKGELVLADDVLDPRTVSGFTSLFYAAYKLPLASLTAILLVAILAPLLNAAGWLHLVMEYWVPVGFPLLVLLLYAVHRNWATALLGALPVLFGRYLVEVLRPAGRGTWAPFFWALAGLFVLYVLAEWLFMPRPVPPVLLLYSTDGPGRPYRREGDAPYWLAGGTYWVWRYMMLTPAELNKFWERDWERTELWIRADGPGAGALEWVVIDAHYRELWIPCGRLGPAERLERHRERAIHDGAHGRPGVWLVEVDANLLFHTPFVRTVSYLPEGEDVPVRSLRHLASALFKRGAGDEVEECLHSLDELKLRSGADVLEDIPEAFAGLAARHMLSLPWRYWRYPLGAQRKRERRLYETVRSEAAPLAADRDLQIKEHVR